MSNFALVHHLFAETQLITFSKEKKKYSNRTTNFTQNPGMRGFFFRNKHRMHKMPASIGACIVLRMTKHKWKIGEVDMIYIFRSFKSLQTQS